MKFSKYNRRRKYHRKPDLTDRMISAVDTMNQLESKGIEMETAYEVSRLIHRIEDKETKS